MNSEKSKTLDLFCSVLNVTDKINLKMSDKSLSDLSIFYK